MDPASSIALNFSASILDALPNMVWCVDANNRLMYTNRAWLDFTGLSYEEESARGWPWGMHPQDLEGCRDTYLRSLVLRQPCTLECRYLRKDGMYRWLSYQGKPLFGPGGSFQSYLGSCQDITEQKQAEADRRRSNQLLELTFDSLSEAILMIDPQTRTILNTNRAFERIFGYSKSEAIGKITRFLFLSQEAYLQFGRDLFPALDRAGIFCTQLRMLRADGIQVIAEVFVTEVRNETGERTLVISDIRDITEQKRAEDDLNRSHQKLKTTLACLEESIAYQNATSRILQLFHEVNDQETYLWGVVRVFQDWSGCRCVGIRISSSPGKAPYRAYTGFSPEFMELENGIDVQDGRCVCPRALLGIPGPSDSRFLTPAGSYFCSNVQASIARLSAEERAQFRGQCIDNKFETILVIPIKHHGRIIGLIHLADESVDLISSEGVVMAESLALLVGQALHRYMLEAENRQSAARSEALARVAGQINVNLDLATVLNKVCEDVASVLHMQTAGVLLVDEKRECLHPKGGYGVPPGFLEDFDGVPLNSFHGLEQRFGPVIVIPDIQSISDLSSLERCIHSATCRVAATGIYYDGELIGVLFVSSCQGPIALSAEEQVLLQAVANQAATAIQNARLFDRLERRAKALETLSRISSSLRQAETMTEILPILIEQIRTVFTADSVAIILQKGQSLEIVAGSGLYQAQVGERYLLDPVGKMLIEDVPRFYSSRSEITDLFANSQVFSPRSWLQNITSCAMIPLATSRATVGLIYLGYRHPRLFTEEERRLAEALAEMISNALLRITVMETMEQRVVDRTRELETLYQVASVANAARSIQEVLDLSLEITLKSIRATAGAIHLIGGRDHARIFPNGDLLDPDSLYLMAHLGLPEEQITPSRAVSIGQCIPGTVAQRNELLVIPDLSASSLTPLASPFSDRPMSYIGFPIRRGATAIGVISIFGEPKRQIQSEVLALLTTISDQLGVVIENARLRQQAELGAVTAERQRLARELHDSITQVLYSLSLFAGAGRNLALEGDREKLQQYFKRIETNVQQALKEMRLLIYELRPSVLENEGLAAALRRRLEAVEKKAGVAYQLIVEGEADLPIGLQSELFWILHEALNNALKYAAASSVIVRLTYSPGKVKAEVLDDGVGFDLAQVEGQGGYGLQSMQERARKIGGTITVQSTPGNGACVQIEVLR